MLVLKFSYFFKKNSLNTLKSIIYRSFHWVVFLFFMKIVITFIAVIFFYTQNVKSQDYSLEYYNQDDYGKFLHYKSYKNLIISINDSLNDLIQTGFIDAKVKSFIKTDSFEYKIKLLKGPRLKNIKISNIDSLDNNLINIYKKHSENNIISFKTLPDFLDSSIEYLSKSGYPFAKLKLENISKMDSISVKSRLSVNLGAKRRIDKITIKGYENFPEKFIKNLLGIKQNSTLNINKISDKISLINETNFARSTKAPEILFTKDSTELFLYIKKVKKNTFDGFLGFNNDNLNKKLKIQGYAKINLNNTFNKGENINFDFLAEDNQDRFLNSKLRIPYVLNTPLSLDTGIKLTKKDSTYNNQLFFFNLAVSFKNLTAGIGVENHNSVTNITSEYIKDFKSEIFNVFINYKLSNLNSLFNKNKLSFLINYGHGKKSQLDFKTNINKLKIEIIKNTKISKKLNVYTRLLNERIESENIVTNELLRFGGNESIRGFDQNSVFANSYILINNNLNFLINDTIYIYTLFDLANYNNKILQISEYIYAGGFGFSTITKNGVISVNYAKGDKLGRSFNLKNAKLSVNFITYFWLITGKIIKKT